MKSRNKKVWDKNQSSLRRRGKENKRGVRGKKIQVFWRKLNKENKTKKAELAELGHRVERHCGQDGRWLVESASREESGVYR